MDDVRSFMDSYLDRDRNLLADRLQRASDRLAEIAPRISAEKGDGDQWNAHEVLAHLAVVSKFYGVLVHRIASRKLSDLNLLEAGEPPHPAGEPVFQREAAQR